MLTKFPLKQVFHKLEASGCLAKWSIELGEFNIQFKPRTAIKGQALADFIAEFTYQLQCKELTKQLTQTSSRWHLYVDSSSTKNSSGIGVILVNLDKVKLRCVLCFRFKATNNQVKYEALLAGLRLAKEVSAHYLMIYSDSQLVVIKLTQSIRLKEKRWHHT